MQIKFFEINGRYNCHLPVSFAPYLTVQRKISRMRGSANLRFTHTRTIPTGSYLKSQNRGVRVQFGGIIYKHI